MCSWLLSDEQNSSCLTPVYRVFGFNPILWIYIYIFGLAHKRYVQWVSGYSPRDACGYQAYCTIKYTNFTASWPIDSVVTGEGALILQVLSEADISGKIIMALPAGSPQIIIAEIFDKTWGFSISNRI